MVDPDDELFERWLSGAQPSNAAAEDAVFDDATRDLDQAPDEAVGGEAPAARAQARSRRGLWRRVRSGEFAPERELDLHRMSRDDAHRAVGSFLRQARRDGIAVVRIICGQGLHSAAEAVLPPLIDAWLRRDFRSELWEALPAPAPLGGRGAYLVFLRPIPPRDQ